ncbi:hypothetical protein MPSEU_000764200 [Mayamaea pseudoterrestris]|nr:hypothetical protein MPSEU_000764200 [Mayamaea pseudoterrestris]
MNTVGEEMKKIYRKLSGVISSLQNRGNADTEVASLEQVRNDLFRLEENIWNVKQQDEIDKCLYCLKCGIKTPFEFGEFAPLLAEEYDVDLELHSQQMVFFSRDSSALDKFIETLMLPAYSCNIKSLRFDIQDAASMGGTPSSLAKVDTICYTRLLAVAAQVGQHLVSLSKLETLSLFIDDSLIPHAAMVFAPMIIACRKVKRLFIKIHQINQEFLPVLKSYVQTLQGLEEFYIDCGTADAKAAILALLHPLGTSLSLRIFHVTAMEVTPCVALALENVLLHPTMEFAELDFLDIASNEAFDIIIRALGQATLKQLYAFGWSYPEQKGVQVAQALVASKIVKLCFDHHCNTVAYYDALGRSFAAESESGCVKLGFDTDTNNMATFFQYADGFTFHTLCLEFRSIETWNEAFTTSFAHYIANNEHLRQLILDCYNGFRYGHMLVSAPLLGAFGKGQGSLDSIHIVSHDEEPTGMDWALTLQKHVASNLNGNRRRSRALFEFAFQHQTESIGQAAFSKALSRVNASARFAFLSDNEFCCRNVLLRDPQEAQEATTCVSVGQRVLLPQGASSGSSRGRRRGNFRHWFAKQKVPMD